MDILATALYFIASFMTVYDHGSYYGIPEQVAGKVNETINQLAENITKLGDITIPKLPIVTGEQEFGQINLTLSNGQVAGLGDFVAETISIKILPPTLQNLTIHFKEIELRGFTYHLAGPLYFPIGTIPIPLSGDGDFWLKLVDLKLTVVADLSAKGGILYIKTLSLSALLGDFQVRLDNAMGGSKAGESLNTVLNDVGVVAFDYYIPRILGALTDPIIEIANEIIKDIMEGNGKT